MKTTSLFIALFALLLATGCKKKEASTDQYELKQSESLANWKGYLQNGYFNEGTIQVVAEKLQCKNGKVVSGEFAMPLSSLVNLNLPEEMKGQLIHHLQSADFFNMALHPNVTFRLTGSSSYNENGPDAVAGANTLVFGTLAILGKPLPIKFPAKVIISEGKLSIAAKIKVDRTKWGMSYMSDNELPADKRILPEIEVNLDLKGEKK